jgi:hypothetical protein
MVVGTTRQVVIAWDTAGNAQDVQQVETQKIDPLTFVAG